MTDDRIPSDDGASDALGRAIRAGLQGGRGEEGGPASRGRRSWSRATVHLRDDGPAPPRAAVPPPGPRVGRRYALADELGRGGVGVVLRGHDEDLGRDVALKFLRPEHADVDAHVARFLREAQIEGQLQHPGIVPVYELGLSADGRPFFAMKLVRGRTLAEILAERRSPEEDRRRFLGIFEQVCHAVAYAHARGVIHRDLKPANVMLGRFGEVQVVDWGFAKVLAEHGPAEGEGGASVPEGIGETRAGSMLGTPPYMPPEQAGRGRAPADERADVFALGAMLLEILTGEPAYRGTPVEVLRKALDADLADAHARLDACVADEELVSLCRACLAADPDERPRDAGRVSERLTRHLTAVEERARRAQLEAAEARVRAEGERRARRLTLALAAAVLLAAVAGAGAWLWIGSERRAEAERAGREVARALAEGREMLGAARGAPVEAAGAWDAVLSTARAAADRAEGAPPEDRTAAAEFLALVEGERATARERRAAWERDRRTLARLAEIRTERGGLMALRDAGARYAAAFRDHGLDLPGGAATAAAVAGSAISEALVSGMDEWAWVRRTLTGRDDPLAVRLTAIASSADPDALRREIRSAADVREGDLLRRARTGTPSVEASRLLARRLSAEGDPAGAVEVLRGAWRRAPQDFWTNFELAEALTALPAPRWEEAIGFYRAALATNPASRGTHASLAVALRAAGLVPEAIDVWREALRRDPSDTTPYRHLLALHEQRGDLPQAIAELEAEARETPEDPRPLVGLGLACLLRRDWAAAVPPLERALALDPDSPALRTHLAEGLLWSGRLREAEAHLLRALAVDPSYAPGWETLHRVRLVGGDDAGALEAVREAARLEPDTPLYVFALAMALHFAKESDQALALCDRFVDLAPFEPLAHAARGTVLMQRNDLEEAAAEIETAIRLVGRGLELAPWGITSVGVLDHETGGYRFHHVPGWDPALGPARAMLATARLRMGDPEGALAALDVRPWDDVTAAHLDWIRYRVLCVQGRLDEAIPLLERLSRNPAVTGEIRYHLGMALLAGRDHVRARESLLAYPERSVWMAGWSYPREEWAEDVDLLLGLARDLPGASAPEEVIGDAREGILLGLLLQAQGRHGASVRAFEAAFAAEPDAKRRLLPWPAPYPATAAAAQSALFTAWGLGSDAALLDAAARAALRGRALAWMRDTLEAMRALARDDAANGPTWLRASARTWLEQGDFALGREEANLRRMPPEEAAAWRAFWEEVRDVTD